MAESAPRTESTDDSTISPRRRTRIQLFTAERGGKLPFTAFHGTDVPPSIIFTVGLTSRHEVDVDPNDEALLKDALHDHVIGNEEGTQAAWRTGCKFLGCGFVGTSKDVNLSLKFALGCFRNEPHEEFRKDKYAYVYEVDVRALEKKVLIADVNRTLRRSSRYPIDYEISALRHIPPEMIMHVFPVRKDLIPYQPGPDDFGPAIRNPVSSRPSTDDGKGEGQ